MDDFVWADNSADSSPIEDSNNDGGFAWASEEAAPNPSIEPSPEYNDLVSILDDIEKTNSEPEWSDYGYNVMAAGADLVESVGHVTGSDSVRNLGTQGKKYWASKQTDAFKKKMSEEGVTAAKVGGAITGSLLPMGLGIGTSALAAKGLIKAGMSAGKAGVIGGALGEGTVAGVSATNAIYNQIMSLPEESIAQSEPYKEAYWSDEISSIANDTERRKAAREVVARDQDNYGALAGILTAALGAPSGAFMGRAIGGEVSSNFAGTALKATALEAAQEAPQSAAERLTQNYAVQGADPSQELTKGVVDDAILGAVAGGVIGGAMSPATHINAKNYEASKENNDLDNALDEIDNYDNAANETQNVEPDSNTDALDANPEGDSNNNPSGPYDINEQPYQDANLSDEEINNLAAESDALMEQAQDIANNRETDSIGLEFDEYGDIDNEYDARVFELAETLEELEPLIADEVMQRAELQNTPTNEIINELEGLINDRTKFSAELSENSQPLQQSQGAGNQAEIPQQQASASEPATKQSEVSLGGVIEPTTEQTPVVDNGADMFANDTQVDNKIDGPEKDLSTKNKNGTNKLADNTAEEEAGIAEFRSLYFTDSGKPYKSKKRAETAMKNLGIETEVVAYEDGFGIRKPDSFKSNIDNNQAETLQKEKADTEARKQRIKDLDKSIAAGEKKIASEKITRKEKAIDRFNKFEATHELSDGTKVIAVEDEPNIWQDAKGEEIEDDSASLISKTTPKLDIKKPVSQVDDVTSIDKKEAAKEIKPEKPVNETSNKVNFSDAYYEKLTNGDAPKNNGQVRKMLRDIEGKEPTQARMKEAQEAIELAVEKYSASVAVKNTDKIDNQSRETKKDSQNFVKSKIGLINFGEISSSIATAIGREKGQIRLQEGDANFGKEHIIERHSKQIENEGFSAEIDFVSDVSKNFSQIWKGEKGALILIKKGKRNRVGIVKLKPNKDGSFYSIETAFPSRGSYPESKGIELLWERSEPSTQASGELDPLATQSESTGQNSANAQGESNKKNIDQKTQKDKIDDLGEKIGGARKDTSVKLGKRTKVKGKLTGWRKQFIVMENLLNGGGSWILFNTKTGKAIRDQNYQAMTFKTEEAAASMLTKAAVSEKHSISGNSENGFTIWRRVGDRKRVQVVADTFKTREEGLEYLFENAEDILDTKLNFGEEVLPTPEKVYREGETRRDGDIEGKDFMAAFGFRAVEFGKWNNQEERQDVMNHAYDALLDIADIIDVPAKALSLNGELALAFGARGQGLSGAKAHYEPKHAVINLTKMSGAGSLAHEWLHSLDHYFGRVDGKAARKMVENDKGNKVFDIKSTEKVMASHGFKYNSDARPELKEAYIKLIKTMFTKAETYVEDTIAAEDWLGRSRDELQTHIDRLLNGLAEQLNPKWYKRNNKPASLEQLTRFDELSDMLVNGEASEIELRQNENKRTRYPGFRDSNDVLDEMSAIYKKVRGRAGFKADKSGVMDALSKRVGFYQSRITTLNEAKDESPKVKSVMTSFAMQANSADQARANAYWSSPHEMAARAFAAYVEDKLKAKNASNDFLVYHAYGTVLVPVYPDGLFRPYPEGKERISINKEFDNLFNIIETEETETGNIIVKQKKSDYSSDYGNENTESKDKGLSKEGRNVGEKDTLPVSIKALGISEEINTVGTATFIGRTITDAKQLAETAQVFRNPRYETVRYFFVKDNVVVHATGVSSRLPGETTAFPNGSSVEWVKSQMRQSGADSLWIIHNHPSGDPTPSNEDILMTQAISKDIKVNGHIIINSNKYSIISSDGNTKTLPLNLGKDKLLTPSKNSTFLNNKIRGPFDLAKIGKTLQKEGFVTIVGTSGESGVRAIIEVEAAFISDGLKARNIIKRFSQSTGSDQVFIYGERSDLNEKSIQYLMNNGFIADAVTESGFAFGNTFSKADENTVMGEDITNADTFLEQDKDKYNKEATDPYIKSAQDLQGEVAKSLGDFDLSAKGRKLGLLVLTNNQISEVFAKIFKKFNHNPVTAFVDKMQNFEGDLMRMMRDADKIRRRWDMLSNNNSAALSKLMSYSTFYGIDLTKGFHKGDIKADYESKFTKLDRKIAVINQNAKTGGKLTTLDAGRIQELQQKKKQIKDRVKNLNQQETQYKILKKQFDEVIDSDSRKLYADVRDAYGEQYENQIDELIERVKRTISDVAKQNELIEDINLKFQKLGDNEVYFPLQRWGDHHLIMTKGDDYVRLHYQTGNQARTEKEKFTKDGWEVEYKKASSNIDSIMGEVPEFASQVIDELDSQGSKIGSDMRAGLSIRDTINQIMLKSAPEVSYLKRSIHRNFVSGFSEDQKRAFAHTMFHGAYRIAKIRHGDLLGQEIKAIDEYSGSKEMSDINKEKAVDVRDELAKRFSLSMNPDGAAWSAMATQFGFVNYLGASLGAGLVNITQTPLFTMPYLGAKYGIGQTTLELTRALKDFAINSEKKLSLSESLITLEDSKGIKANERKMVKELINDGTIETTQMSSLAQLSETDTLSEYSDFRDKSMRAIGYVFHNAEILNRQVTALATYRLDYRKNKDHDKAVKAAKKAIYDTHFDYSTHNKARFMRGNISKIIFTFKNYSQQATYLILKNGLKAFKGDKEAQKFVGIATLSHLALAGVVGLPFYGAVKLIAELLDEAFDDGVEDKEVEYKKWVRDLAKAAGAENPEKVQNLINKGIVNTYLGIDISSRISSDVISMWLRQDDLDVQDRNFVVKAIIQGLGPVFGGYFMKNFDGVFNAVKDGNLSKAAIKAAPIKGLRDLLKGVRLEREGLKNYKGDPIFTKEEISTKDAIVQGIGFTPSKVSEGYDKISGDRVVNKNISQIASRLMDRIEQAVKDKDFKERKKVLDLIREFNKKYPTHAIHVGRGLKGRFRNSALNRGGIKLGKKSYQYLKDSPYYLE